MKISDDEYYFPTDFVLEFEDELDAWRRLRKRCVDRDPIFPWMRYSRRHNDWVAGNYDETTYDRWQAGKLKFITKDEAAIVILSGMYNGNKVNL